ncbi:MAG: hypothetical protein ACK5GI_08080, partial [Ignavibacteria bacterium]
MRFLWSSLLLGCAIALAACTTADPLQPGTTRIRKNVKSLTSEEKADFVNAVKKLKTVQSPYDPAINYYDQFVKWHYLAFRCKPNNFDVHG